jgi:hypothetical protein
MTGKSRRWQRHLFLLVLSGLVACSSAENAEKLIALAEQPRHEGQVNVAADLYHRAAELRPHDFHTQYRTALLYLQIDKGTENEACKISAIGHKTLIFINL